VFTIDRTLRLRPEKRRASAQDAGLSFKSDFPMSEMHSHHNLVNSGIFCYNSTTMKTKLTLGWLLILTGTVFLICGLGVMIFATLRFGPAGPMGGEIPDPSLWATLANAVMRFVIELLNVQWTPARAGVFLIVVGLFLDGGGAYILISDQPKPKRRKTRRTR
jgi:hypothetical protein